MSIIGYARVSSTDQDLTLQLEALQAAKCDVVGSEKVSGTSRAGRTELARIMEFIRQGDVLVVTRIDRLARSIGDLQDIVRALKAKQATLRVIEQPIDTSTAAGKAFLDMLGVFAEFETNLRRERQLEGIAKAKAKGVYKGRKRSIDAATVRDLQASGLGPTEIAKTLGIGRASVYRHIRDPQTITTKPDPLAFNDDAQTIATKPDPLAEPFDESDLMMIAEWERKNVSGSAAAAAALPEGTENAMTLSAESYRGALYAWFREATQNGATYVDVIARDLYAKAGGTPADKQMPNCCSVMMQEARTRAQVLSGSPPSRQGPNLSIRFSLPR